MAIIISMMLAALLPKNILPIDFTVIHSATRPGIAWLSIAHKWDNRKTQCYDLIKGPPPAVRHNIALSTTGLLLVVIIPAEYINFLI